MRKLLFVFICIFFHVCVTAGGYALPKYGEKELLSPQKDCSLKLVDADRPWTYKLEVFRSGILLARYPFKGELLSASWSPSSSFVAVNTHYGHGGFDVWIISLTDGSFITSHGAIHDRNFDPYGDDRLFPDLLTEADSELKKIYPQADEDQLRNGYSSVAYGWRGDNNLLTFHQLGFDDFDIKYRLLIQAYTVWEVNNRGVRLKSVRFRKARDDQYEPMPSKVRKTLNFIP